MNQPFFPCVKSFLYADYTLLCCSSGNCMGRNSTPIPQGASSCCASPKTNGVEIPSRICGIWTPSLQYERISVILRRPWKRTLDHIWGKPFFSASFEACATACEHVGLFLPQRILSKRCRKDKCFAHALPHVSYTAFHWLTWNCTYHTWT